MFRWIFSSVLKFHFLRSRWTKFMRVLSCLFCRKYQKVVFVRKSKKNHNLPFFSWFYRYQPPHTHISKQHKHFKFMKIGLILSFFFCFFLWPGLFCYFIKNVAIFFNGNRMNIHCISDCPFWTVNCDKKCKSMRK